MMIHNTLNHSLCWVTLIYHYPFDEPVTNKRRNVLGYNGSKYDIAMFIATAYNINFISFQKKCMRIHTHERKL